MSYAQKFGKSKESVHYDTIPDRLNSMVRTRFPDLDQSQRQDVVNDLLRLFDMHCRAESGAFPEIKLQLTIHPELGDDEVQTVNTLRKKIHHYLPAINAHDLPIDVLGLINDVGGLARETVENNRSVTASVDANPGWFTGWGERVGQTEWANMPEHLKTNSR